MIKRVPPALATWLLERFGPHYHAESMAGDLVEQYQQGRGRLWFCRQVATAIWVGRARHMRALPWAALRRGVSRILLEAAAVLAVVVVGAGTFTWADGARREVCPGAATSPASTAATPLEAAPSMAAAPSAVAASCNCPGK